MPLIDATYFAGPLLLSGAAEPFTAAAINQAIAAYEAEYLDGVLGASFAELFQYGVAHPVGGGFDEGFDEGFDTGSIEARWSWLLTGKVFVLGDGRSTRWPGFQNALKQSPLACYVYYHYRRDNVSQPGQTGNEGIVSSENTSKTSPDDKMAQAWKMMQRMHRDLFCVLQHARINGAAVYPEFNPRDVSAAMFQTTNTFGI